MSDLIEKMLFFLFFYLVFLKEIICLNRGFYNNYEYQLVSGIFGKSLVLECKQINETISMFDNRSPTWKKITKSSKIIRKKSLKFKKLELKDSGLYNCHRNGSEDEPPEDFNYFLEVIKKSKITNGTLTDWINYRENFINPVEIILEQESLFNQSAKLSYIWDEFGPCFCGTTKLSSKKFRTGFCSIQLNDTENENLLLSCQSELFKELFPFFYEITENLLNFKQFEFCLESCIPSASEDFEEDDFKFKETIYAQESSHLILKCLGTDNNTQIDQIQWLKNNEIFFNISQNSPGNRISVDLNGFLYILGVLQEDEGFYGCFLKRKPIKQILIRVVPKSILSSAGNSPFYFFLYPIKRYRGKEVITFEIIPTFFYIPLHSLIIIILKSNQHFNDSSMSENFISDLPSLFFVA